jgi:hypothetical protein
VLVSCPRMRYCRKYKCEMILSLECEIVRRVVGASADVLYVLPVSYFEVLS